MLAATDLKPCLDHLDAYLGMWSSRTAISSGQASDALITLAVMYEFAVYDDRRLSALSVRLRDQALAWLEAGGTVSAGTVIDALLDTRWALTRVQHVTRA